MQLLSSEIKGDIIMIKQEVLNHVKVHLENTWEFLKIKTIMTQILKFEINT